jgi:hypothetical protein
MLSTTQFEKLYEISNNFIIYCNSHYLTVFDSLWGMGLLKQKMEKGIENGSINPYEQNKDETSNGEIKNLGTPIELLERINSKQNVRFLTMMYIVYIYSQWDEVVRLEIKEVLGQFPKLKEIEIMNDLRILRNCIVHQEGKVCKSPKNNEDDLTKTKLFKDLMNEKNYGDIITLNGDQLCIIIKKIYEDLNKYLKKQATGG